MLEVKIKLLHPNARIPERMTLGAAGYDLFAAYTKVNYSLPGERKRVPCGFAIQIPPGWEGQIRPRSGLAFDHGITVANAPGTIDSDYRGEVCVLLANYGPSLFPIVPGERIAQLVFAPVVRASFVPVTELDSTDRGQQGFGSTGR